MKKSTLNRMLELANIKPVIKESKPHLSNFELVKNSVNGKSYAIVKENKKYYIKEAETKDTLSESDFDYVGGVMNKVKKSFNSFSDATKHLNLMFEEINNHFSVSDTNLLESDVELNEKRFVLRTKKPKRKEKSLEFDFEDDLELDDEGETGFDKFDFGDETFNDTEDEGIDDTGDETFNDTEDVSDDEIRQIQSTTGTLGQQLRDVEDLSSDMMKWVAKSVLAALDLDNMDADDKQDVVNTIGVVSVPDTDEDVEEIEESLSDDPFDGMDSYMWEYNEEDQVGDDVPIANPDEVGHDMLLLDKVPPKKRDSMGHGFKKNKSHKSIGDDINEDHLNHEMNSVKQEKSYEDVESHVRKFGMDVDLKMKVDDLVYLNVVEDGKNILVVEIDIMGSIRVGKMVGRKFIGHPIDDLSDFDYIFGRELTTTQKMELDMTENLSTTEPKTKPKDPSVKPGRERPSRRPFTPPPKIDPNDPETLPGTKAVYDKKGNRLVGEYDDVLGSSPTPSKPIPTKDPSVKPGRERPGRERPSRRPFTPPPHIKPGEEPGPKADYDDLDFE